MADDKKQVEVKKPEKAKQPETKVETRTEVEVKKNLVKEEKPKAEKTETPQPKKKTQSVKLSAKLQKIVEEIEKLTVLEVAELVKALEDKFGVSSMPVMAASTVAAAAGAGEVKEEKTEFTVVLKAAGSNKIAAIKAVREIKQTLGLKEAKDLVEKGNAVLLENVKKEEAEGAKKKLEAAGATVELK